MIRMFAAVFVLAAGLTACSEPEQSGPQERATPVTTAQVESRTVERVAHSIGRLRPNSAPTVSAETAGRIRAIHADVGDEVVAGDLLAEINDEVQRIAVNSSRAELRRLGALLENEQRRVRRLSGLAEQQSIPRDQLDEAQTAVESLEAQIESGQARVEEAEYNLRQTRILSPVSGRVEARLISEGDYVAPSVRVYALVSGQALQAQLPLPEHLLGEVAIGQPVELSVPAYPDDRVSANVTDLRPSIGTSSSAIEVIVDLDDQPAWRPGGSVSARVILDRHEALVVPPVSVVRRPAGEVVYVITGERVRQQRVSVGLRGEGWIEIVAGLESGDRVAADGAGFLTDGARVDAQAPGASP